GIEDDHRRRAVDGEFADFRARIAGLVADDHDECEVAFELDVARLAEGNRQADRAESDRIIGIVLVELALVRVAAQENSTGEVRIRTAWIDSVAVDRRALDESAVADTRDRDLRSVGVVVEHDGPG